MIQTDGIALSVCLEKDGLQRRGKRKREAEDVATGESHVRRVACCGL
jgi:hypothetical protein